MSRYDDFKSTANLYSDFDDNKGFLGKLFDKKSDDSVNEKSSADDEFADSDLSQFTHYTTPYTPSIAYVFEKVIRFLTCVFAIMLIIKLLPICYKLFEATLIKLGDVNDATVPQIEVGEFDYNILIATAGILFISLFIPIIKRAMTLEHHWWFNHSMTDSSDIADMLNTNTYEGKFIDAVYAFQSIYGDKVQMEALRAGYGGRIVSISDLPFFKEGDVIAVIEAMKMEMPVVAPYDCMVVASPLEEGIDLIDNEAVVVISKAILNKNIKKEFDDFYGNQESAASNEDEVSDNE
jgi:hypothetical protein